MFRMLGHFAATRAKLALVISGLIVVVTGAIGATVIPAMSSAGYDDPGSDSARAYRYLKDNFGVTDPWTVFILDCARPVDDATCTAGADAIAAAASDVEGVDRVASYWSMGRPATLRSTDGEAAYMFVYQQGDDVGQLNKDASAIEEAALAAAARTGIELHSTGSGALFNGINGRVTSDIAQAESIAIPLSILLTLIVFGGLLAALTPLTVALFAIPTALFVLWVVQRFTDVSVFGLNILTGLGIGLGIDYALLIVSRFREEQAVEPDIEKAVIRTIESAGRTVFFSGLTVALTLASLGMFPLYFLQTFAWAGVSVVLFAVLGALVPMPALLALVGHNIDRWRVRRVAPVSDHGMWARVAGFVMHRPWPVVLVTLVALGVFAAPALHLQTGQPDERVMPADSPIAIAGQVARERFDARETQPIEVVVPGGADVPQRVASYAIRLSRIEHIVRVVTPTAVIVDGVVVAPNPSPAGMQAGADLKILAIGDVDARSPDGEALVQAVRALEEPTADTMVGGSAAIYTDAQHGVLDNIPQSMLWIAVMTLIVLFLFTGSVLLPIKAVLLNVLSLAATFGVITWIFQDGHLSELLGGFTLRGVVDTSQLVLIVIVVFGLSMDYELFLLSRIKELHDAGADTREAVMLGLQRSGRIITAAALILAAVFSSFMISGVTSMKLIGFGVSFAILLDATIVRALLVPALMRIAGQWNWWAPAPLRRLHERLHITH